MNNKNSKVIDISVVVPTMNEELTIGLFIDWCNLGFSNAGINGEIVILDNSIDQTPQIALSKGARVVSVPIPGLGNAYKAGQNQARGKWIIMGDADCTYDFRNLGPFIGKLTEGFDFVIGNRFIGSIEKGAMPPHHQYFGSPATSLIFKLGLGLPTGDIHCGMRAMTRDLYNKLPFLETGWEYATEMIVSARNLNAKIAEVPIHFLKEPEGRVSHHRRSSWLSPFRAGWGTLRVTTTYMIDRFFVVPGIVISLLAISFNMLIFIFPNIFLQKFHAGLLSQSILLFVSLIGSFMFAIGMLSRIAYRRRLKSLSFFTRKNSANRLFTLLTIGSLVEFSIGILVVDQWSKGLGKDPTQIHYNSKLISFWFSTTSIYSQILSLGIVSLIGNHAYKQKD